MSELSHHDWDDTPPSGSEQRRLSVLRENILKREAEVRKRGLKIPLHEERGLLLEGGDDPEVDIARLSGYLESLDQALEQTGSKRVVDSAAEQRSREQGEYWLHELLARAEEFFPEALAVIKPGMIADTAPFPLEDLVKKIHGDQTLLPAERRHLDEVILAVRLRWDRLVRGQLKLTGEKHFRKREAGCHLLKDPKLWQIIFSQEVLVPVFKKVPAEILAEAAAEAFVAKDYSHEQIRTEILDALASSGQTPVHAKDISPEFFNRLVIYFQEKGEAIVRAYEMILRLTHPESWQRVIASPELLDHLRQKLAGITSIDEKIMDEHFRAQIDAIRRDEDDGGRVYHA